MEPTEQQDQKVAGAAGSPMTVPEPAEVEIESDQVTVVSAEAPEQSDVQTAVEQDVVSAEIDSKPADSDAIEVEPNEPSVATLTEAKRAIEAIILVTADPISSQLLAQLLELPTTVVNNLVAELAGEYDADHRGFELVGVAGGWRYQTRSDLYQYVERFALEGFSNKLSKAALETLSIVAYKQPISRSQITAIRGVNADGVLKTLEQRGYVEETGRDDGPGQAMLFGTTMFFLERLGINSIDDLPPLGDFVPSAEALEILEESLRIEDTPEPTNVDDGSNDFSEEE